MTASGFPDYPNAFTGVDLKTGKRINLFKEAFGKQAPDLRETIPTSSTTFDTGSAVSAPSKETEELLKFFRAMSPERIKEYETMGDIATRQQLQQISQLYPFLSAAGRESTARSLAASQAYRAFAEQLPSNIQNIMASKQQQRQSAQQGEAALQLATADQLRAAKESQGRFAGQYIQFG